MTKKYYHTPESVKEYIQLAKDVNGKELITELKKVLPAASTVLELGSGPGTDWEILSESYRVTGSDYSEEFLKHLRNSHPGGSFIQLNAATLETEQTFDGIYSNKVLHLLTDDELVSSVAQQACILNSGGIICHSFWKGEDSEEFNGMLVNYHTSSQLTDFFGDKFELLQFTEYKEFEADDSILLIGRKK